MDEHRIGLNPPARRVWAPIAKRSFVRMRHRFTWCYLAGFVHPVSDRTLFVSQFHQTHLPPSLLRAAYPL